MEGVTSKGHILSIFLKYNDLSVLPFMLSHNFDHPTDWRVLTRCNPIIEEGRLERSTRRKATTLLAGRSVTVVLNECYRSETQLVLG